MLGGASTRAAVPFIPTEWHGREVIVLAMCWCGDHAAGEAALAPLRTFGKPIADVVAPQPLVQWQQALDPLLTAGMRNYWKSHDFRTLSEPLVDTLVEFARRIPDPNSDILLGQLGGAVKRVGVHDTAYAHRDAEFVLNVHGRWAERSEDARCIAWARALFDAAAPYATGAYVNFMTGDEGDRVRSAYGDNYARLTALKEQWDPTNLFRVNQNIRPA